MIETENTVRAGGIRITSIYYQCGEHIQDKVGVGQSINETNTLAKESNRIANQRQLIMLAQHLGKEDILEELLTSLTSNSTSSNSGGGVLDG